MRALSHRPEKPRAWVFAVAANLARDEARAAVRRAEGDEHAVLDVVEHHAAVSLAACGDSPDYYIAQLEQFIQATIVARQSVLQYRDSELPIRRIAWRLVEGIDVVFGVFLFYPMVRTIWLGFYQEDPFGGRAYVGFDQYAEVLGSASFWGQVRNSTLTQNVAVYGGAVESDVIQAHHATIVANRVQFWNLATAAGKFVVAATIAPRRLSRGKKSPPRSGSIIGATATPKTVTMMLNSGVSG